MTARIIDGKAIAAELRARVAAGGARARPRAASCRGWPSCWSATIRRARSMSATRARRCRKPACARSTRLPAKASEAELLALVRELNADPPVHGILVQMPLPPQIDALRIIAAVDPAKDVDGFHPLNAGRLATGLPALVPCTPLGCIMLAKTVHAFAGRPGSGGGRPLQHRRQAAGATAAAGKYDGDDRAFQDPRLAAVCRRADSLFAAIGRPK